MTGRELHRARKALGFRSMAKFGVAMGLEVSEVDHARRTVSRWENGETPIPRHVELLIQAMSTGWRPRIGA